MKFVRPALACCLLLLTIAACQPAASSSPTPGPVPPPAPTWTPPPPTLPPPVVEVEHLYLRSDVFGAGRLVDVYLPPGYAGGDGRYPVLYANDGQDMEVIHLRTLLQDLYAQGAIAPFLFVAVHAGPFRTEEYGVAGHPALMDIGKRADRYTAFLLDEVMPYINANYRTLTGPAHTAVMGWSLGGLSAFDLAWTHPDVFGAAGCFSGSFWVHTDGSTLQSLLDTRVAFRLVEERPAPPGLRFWFQTGFLEEQNDRDGNGVIDVVQDARELVALLRSRGYTDVVLLEIPDGGHDKLTWSQALPEFLRWVFPGR